MKLKLIGTALICLSLQGCFYQSVAGNEVRFIQKFCNDKGGLYDIDEMWHGEAHFQCKDSYQDDNKPIVRKRYYLSREQIRTVMEEYNND